MKYLVDLYRAGVACFRAGTLSTKLSTPEQRLVSKESATVATWQGVILFQGSSSVKVKKLEFTLVRAVL